MVSLVNLGSYQPPVPIPPVPPNFHFCSGAFGTNLVQDDAFRAASLLPRGALPVTYSVEVPDTDDLAANVSALEMGYELPFLEAYGSAWIAVDVSGPISIDKLTVVPNDIRGMAAWVARQCVGRDRVGGFVTRRIQGLVDFVTDPTSDIEAPTYPDSTAFLTVAVTNMDNSAVFPGDYDPEMAKALREAELNAFIRAQPHDRIVLAERIQQFAEAEANMRRLGTDVPWWGGWLMQGNQTTHRNIHLANMTTEGVATVRRKKRVPGFLR